MYVQYHERPEHYDPNSNPTNSVNIFAVSVDVLESALPAIRVLFSLDSNALCQPSSTPANA